MHQNVIVTNKNKYCPITLRQ